MHHSRANGDDAIAEEGSAIRAEYYLLLLQDSQSFGLDPYCPEVLLAV
jgi:hypothetical protein